MNRDVYQMGAKGAKWGIWNRRKKEWQFRICEDTPMLAEARLYQMIGDKAWRWRYKARRLPTNLQKKYDRPAIILNALRIVTAERDQLRENERQIRNVIKELGFERFNQFVEAFRQMKSAEDTAARCPCGLHEHTEEEDCEATGSELCCPVVDEPGDDE